MLSAEDPLIDTVGSVAKSLTSEWENKAETIRCLGKDGDFHKLRNTLAETEMSLDEDWDDFMCKYSRRAPTDVDALWRYWQIWSELSMARNSLSMLIQMASTGLADGAWSGTVQSETSMEA